MQLDDKAEEFFYDDGGKPSDAEFHDPIVASGDIKRGLKPPLVDKSKLDAIRAKHQGRARRT